MRKENIVVHELVPIEISPKIMEGLDTSMVNEEFGIAVTLNKDENELIDFFAKLLTQNPPVVLKIMKDYPSIGLWDLKRRALAYQWFKTLPIKGRQDLFEAWYLLKFLCQEIHNPTARSLGKSLAELKKSVSLDILEKYREDILQILQNPSAPNRIRNSLWKNYTHQVKKTGITMDFIKDPDDPSSLDTLVYELKVLEEEALKTNVFFGTSPVIYKALL